MIFFPFAGGSISSSGTQRITGLKLVTMALRLLQKCSATGTPSPEDAQTGLEILNQFIDDLRTHDAASPGLLRKTYPLASGTKQYSIGEGGDFDQVWPEDLELASIVPNRADSPITEIPITIIRTIAGFQSLAQKDTTSPYPSAIYYDRNCLDGLGLIDVYPVSTIDDADLILYTANILGTFADLTTEYHFKPGYLRMLRYNLTVELAPEFEVEAPATVQRLATTSLANVKRGNFRPQPAQLDSAMPGMGRSGRPFNPWTGQ